ncbi:MAG: V-type ATP synthase subunit E [Clostridia bacterium]|nr:V-type ATP synthase subunit E [Clostridia bacterium]
MDRTQEKLAKFSDMVMKEADQKKKDIISQAEKDHKEAIAAGEIQFLKVAYERIQEAVRKIDKDINEEVSKAIVESKQALFNRRDEIMDSVFQNIKTKLLAFRKTEDYKGYLERLVNSGVADLGTGDIRVVVDTEDISLTEAIRDKMGAHFAIVESDEQLLGGCLVINKTRGFMCDYSFMSRLMGEKEAFLETYELSIE